VAFICNFLRLGGSLSWRIRLVRMRMVVSMFGGGQMVASKPAARKIVVRQIDICRLGSR
jgi:hypothetical protein